MRPESMVFLLDQLPVAVRATSITSVEGTVLQGRRVFYGLRGQNIAVCVNPKRCSSSWPTIEAWPYQGCRRYPHGDSKQSTDKDNCNEYSFPLSIRFPLVTHYPEELWRPKPTDAVDLNSNKQCAQGYTSPGRELSANVCEDDRSE